MRALKMMLFLTAMVSFVSCSKDDNDPVVDHAMLMGEWNLTEFSYTGTSSTSYGDQTVSLSYTGVGVDLDARITFVDATNYTTEGGYTVELTTTVAGESMVENYTFSNIDASGTYKIEGDKIITTPQAAAHGQVQLMGASQGTIQELTPTRMVLVMEERLSTTMEGMQVETTLDLIQVLSR